MTLIVRATKSKTDQEWVVEFFEKHLDNRREERLWTKVYSYFKPIAYPRIRRQLLTSETIRRRLPEACLLQETEDIYHDSICVLFNNRDEIITIKKNAKRKVVDSTDIKLISRYLLTTIRYITFNHAAKIENEAQLLERPAEEQLNSISNSKGGCRGKPLNSDTFLFIRIVSRRVPKKFKEVIDAHVMEELRFKEVAKKLGIKEETARQRYKRGLALFREEIVKEAEQSLGKSLWDDRMLASLIKELK